MVEKYRNQLVLVLGSKHYVTVAKSYGFQKVISIPDFLHTRPELYPFRSYTKKVHPFLIGDDSICEPVKAVLIFHDPIDWAPEIQVVCDIVQGGGSLSRVNHKNSNSNSGNTMDVPQTVSIYASNPDLVFASSFWKPRLAQGAFVKALEAVYESCYDGKPLQITRFGKWKECELEGIVGEECMKSLCRLYVLSSFFIIPLFDFNYQKIKQNKLIR